MPSKSVLRQPTPDLDQILEEVIHHSFPADSLLYEKIRPTKRPLILKDAQKDPRFRGWGDTHYVRGWMGVPLQTSGEVIGYVTIDSRTVGAYSENEAALAMPFANQAALAIKHARLLAEARHALAREQRLTEITRIITGTLDLSTVLTHVVRLAAKLVDADAGAIALRTPGSTAMTYPYLYNVPEWLRSQQAARGEGLAWEVVERGETIMLSDYAQYPQALPAWVEIGVKATITVPIMVGATCFGALGLFGLTSETTFSDHDVAMAEAVGRQAGVAVQNARLHQQVQRQTIQQKALNKVIAAATAELELLDLLETALEYSLDAFRVKMGYISLENEVVVRGVPPEFDTHVRQHLWQHAGRTQRLSPLAIEDWCKLDGDAPHYQLVDAMQAFGIRASLIVPILDEDHPIGNIGMAAPTARPWSSDEIALITSIGRQLGGATKRARFFAAEQRRRQELNALYKLSRRLIATSNTTDILDTVARHTVENVDTTFCRVLVREGETLHCRAAHTIRKLPFTLAADRVEPQSVWQQKRLKIFAGAHSSTTSEKSAYPIASCKSRGRLPQPNGRP